MLEVGALLDGKYRIVRLLGEGGMGSVFEGTNLLIERRVAIKVLHRSATARDPRAVKRFGREARAAGLIGNDHILEILDLGVLPSGESYLVMEFLDGEPLSERLRKRGTLEIDELRPILEQTLDGLRAAHRAGIVHRDLKPENLYLLREKATIRDFVKIIDFGISKFSETADEMRMTKTGALLGTPYYMSPEQARGADQVTERSDLYSLGVIAYEALTGKRPYDGGTVNELLFKIVLSDAPSLSTLSPSLDREFVSIVERAMARDPGQRFASADEFLAALADYGKGVTKTLDIGTPAPLIEPPRAEARRGTAPKVGELGAPDDFSDVDGGEPIVPMHRSKAPLVAMVGLALAAGGGAWLLFEPAEERSSADEAAGPDRIPKGTTSPGGTSIPLPTPTAPAPSPSTAPIVPSGLSRETTTPAPVTSALEAKVPASRPTSASPGQPRSTPTSGARAQAAVPSTTSAAPTSPPPEPPRDAPAPRPKARPDFGY